MKSIKQTINDKIAELKLFGTTFQTQHQFVEYLISCYNVQYTHVTNGMKQRGCNAGPCACTGYCKQMVQADELDSLSNLSYTIMYKNIMDVIQYTNINQIIKV